MLFSFFKNLNSFFFLKNKYFLFFNTNKNQNNRLLNYKKITGFTIENFKIIKYKNNSILYLGLRKKIKILKIKKRFKILRIHNIYPIINSYTQKKLLKKRDKLVDSILFFEFFNNLETMFDYKTISNKTSNYFFQNSYVLNNIKKNEKKISYCIKVPSSHYFK
uniref:Uncharacterized protein orf162 n=1 Tax=Cyanophora paradoxa TaxID=2762 RepID=E9P1C8_CYAPA|nr:hypothetical protein CYPAM_p09 [Cyanophora paradoxa]ADW79180.1 hypothetical protein [Cyanophora paradoxa]